MKLSKNIKRYNGLLFQSIYNAHETIDSITYDITYQWKRTYKRGRWTEEYIPILKQICPCVPTSDMFLDPTLKKHLKEMTIQ